MKLSLSCAIAASVFATAAPGADLRLETVLPERTGLALSLSGVESLMQRLDEAGVLQALMDGSSDSISDAALESLPRHLRAPLRQVIGDQNPFTLLKGVSIGGGVWPMDTPSGDVPIEWLVWCDLGELESSIGPVIDESFGDLRGTVDGSSERIGDIDVDHFGPDSGPESVWYVHHGGHVMAASSRAGMKRMIAVMNDEPIDGTPLGETETWMEASTLMGGSTGMRLVLMPEIMIDIVQMTSQGAMVGMARPVATTVIGRHDAWALRIDGGQDDIVLQLNGGTYMPDGVDGLLSLVVDANGRNDALRHFVDANTVAVTELNIAFDATTDLVDQLIASSPMLFMAKQPFDQVRPVLEDFLSPLGTQVTQLVSVQQPVTADSLRTLIVFEVEDERSLEDAFSKHLAQGGFKAREFQGRQIWSMQMPALVPGMPAEALAVVAAGNWMFIGDDAAVEAAIRAIGTNGIRPAWSEAMPLGIQNRLQTHAAVKGIVDLHGAFATLLEIEALKNDRIRKALQAQDPELWEELAGDMGDEDATMLHQAKSLASVLGVLFWTVERTETGFTLYGAVSASQDK